MEKITNLEQTFFWEYLECIGEKKKLLQQVEAISMTSRNHTSVRTLRDDVSDLMAKEECLWQQRGHVEWLKLGGRLVMLFVFFENTCG